MRYWLILFFLTVTLTGIAQVGFKTLVPQQPVVSGESFQVQYIIEDADRATNIKPPAFSNFRFVAGPNTYTGTVSTSKGIVALKNLVYTLEAVKPGSFIIPGATLVMNGQTYRSNDVKIQVISKKEAANRTNAERSPNWDYVLAPGENVQEKIKQNLFVKVSVNKKNCYVGEPVLAIFKLYSRLQSKSDIIKNPGFYGFTVYDMINLQDKMVATESLNGKLFDVHTIRKVQLYPLQAGSFTIDAMEVISKVEFSKSAVNKKTEQEISEGLLGKNDEAKPGEGTEIYETSLSTEPISIKVKPVPEKGRPAAFSGAAGNFTISAALLKDSLAKNEEGILEIVIKGKGNFVQLDAPVIQWPAGMEGFAPVVKDALDKTMIPLAGNRAFRFSFVCSNAGMYSLPSVSFSFFDTDSNSFKTVAAKGMQVTVSNAERKSPVAEERKTSITVQSENAARMAVVVVVSLVLLILVYWGFRKKEKQVPAVKQEEKVLPSVQALLAPVYLQSAAEDTLFYRELHGAIWNYLHQCFGLSGSEMNKQTLTENMQKAGVAEETGRELHIVLELAETEMYTNVSFTGDKKELLARVEEILNKINSDLVKQA